jgi:hypothetical protein
LLVCSLVLFADRVYAQSGDYRTAWPIQVPVLQPDPVLGDERVWESWIYGSTFAQRFQGFDPAKADLQMQPGVHAIVFRTYKRRVLDDAPETFACEYEIYFKSQVTVPLGDVAAVAPVYPEGVTAAYRRLRPFKQEDEAHLLAARHDKRRSRSMPLIVADGKLDGRYARFAMTTYPNVVPGISVARLAGILACDAAAPKRPGSTYWIWIFGELSFNPHTGSNPYWYSDAFRRWLSEGTFNAGPLDKALAQGYVRLPEVLFESVLPKVTLIKAVNQCIGLRSGYSRGTVKDVDGSKREDMAACAAVEERGEIYQITTRGPIRGWRGLGF